MNRLVLTCVCLGMSLWSGMNLVADELAEDVQKLQKSAVSFLRNTQEDDGSWTSSTAPGISGLVVRSLLDSGLGPQDPTVARGLAHLRSFVQKDGGIYHPSTTHRNYETCIALMAFEAANTNGQYDQLIAGARKFLEKLQWDQGEGLESSDTAFGGAGYGSHERPDMSNTQFLIEALKTAGAADDDPALQKALKFVSRCQNLESPHNTTEFASKINDGGFYYTVAAGGESKAGLTDDGGLRSYGSMTYAGLKSMIYAGLKQDDPRVKAAFGWISKNYTLRENPGVGQQGLFYYYHTLAKTLDVMKVDKLTDSQGQQHAWRSDLVGRLAELQKSNGSWVNPQDRWNEGDPNMVTAYSLMALSHCD